MHHSLVVAGLGLVAKGLGFVVTGLGFVVTGLGFVVTGLGDAVVAKFEVDTGLGIPMTQNERIYTPTT